MEQRAQDTATDGAERARAAGFADVSSLATPVEVNVLATLVGVAAKRDAALLTLGARGLSPARAAVVGSLSRGVAEHAAAPVLVVPALSSG
jgi:nucleotide-binding universal stress UspA family protein